MRFIGTALSLLIITVMNSLAFSQDDSIFNGNGINMNRATSTRTMMFDFSRLANEPEPASKPAFKFPKIEIPKWEPPKWEPPKWEPPKWNISGMFQPKKLSESAPLSNDESESSLFELPKWNMFPERDPQQPSLLERMNDRNREFWGKTKESLSSWTTDSDNSTTSRGFDTWNRITQGFQSNPKESNPPAQPPLRSARQKDEKTTIRY